MKISTHVNIPADLMRDFYQGGILDPELWLVEIMWEDIAEHGETTWLEVDDLDEWLGRPHNFTCVSTGYILKVDARCLVFCNTFSIGGNGDSDTVCGVNKMPIGVIRRITKVKKFRIKGSPLDPEMRDRI